MKIVKIDLEKRSYDINIGTGLLEKSFCKFLPFDIAGKKAFIITDDNVEPYAIKVQKSLSANGAVFSEIIVMPHGEGTKSYDNLIKIHNWLLENNINRNSMIFAVGGGVIGDLAGFCASTILRGVPYVQVPTTLLSQVDSSVGGKTGINTKYGKNLVGSFYQPAAVITDIESLKTLPKRELLAGFAEVIKYGLIADLSFFNWLEENTNKILNLDIDAISYAIQTSCKAKARIVEEDECESGQRALLNLGHSFGHALEAAAGYNGDLLHGEAVAIGTIMAFDLSVKIGACAPDQAIRVKKYFKHIGLPVNANNINASAEELIITMRRDKKVLNNKMTFILVKKIGDAFITQDIEENLVRDILTQSLNGK